MFTWEIAFLGNFQNRAHGHVSARAAVQHRLRRSALACGWPRLSEWCQHSEHSIILAQDYFKFKAIYDTKIWIFVRSVWHSRSDYKWMLSRGLRLQRFLNSTAVLHTHFLSLSLSRWQDERKSNLRSFISRLSDILQPQRSGCMLRTYWASLNSRRLNSH